MTAAAAAAAAAAAETTTHKQLHARNTREPRASHLNVARSWVAQRPDVEHTFQRSLNDLHKGTHDPICDYTVPPRAHRSRASERRGGKREGWQLGLWIGAWVGFTS